jgi:CO/xanthine dehydrogenase Mo-binding subunit
MRFGIGQPVTRKEDRRFLTGQGRYIADIEIARQVYASLYFFRMLMRTFAPSTKLRRSKYPAFTQC